MSRTEAGRGRPRDPHVDRAIEHAALELLREDGFAGFTIEKLAVRAGVGKAAIYRRWTNKTALVVGAVMRRATEVIVWHDTGDLRADLLDYLAQLLRCAQGAEGQLMTAVLGEVSRNAELRVAFQEGFIRPRRAEIRRRVQRGVDDGQLPADSDVELLADVGVALIYERLLVSGAPLPRNLPARIVRQFLPPLAP